mgnify:CR=1 FL=1
MNRTIKELYQILLDFYKGGNSVYSNFICSNITGLRNRFLISVDESKILHSHFIMNMPHENYLKEFTEHENWLGQYTWWNNVEREQRILFLETIIKNLK